MQIVKLPQNIKEAKIKLSGLTQDKYESNSTKINIVNEIIEKVIKFKDKALIEFSNRFDKSNFKNAKDFIVSEEEIKNSEKLVSKELKGAFKESYKRIKQYHLKQLPKDFIYKDKDGVKLGNLWKAVKKVGVYVPGGTAVYPSSLLMSAVPAIVSGVNEIIICTPSFEGKINPAILYVAKLCKIKKIYKLGGSQAIAAMAYGSETIESVDKIVGPGNDYVALAKKLVFGKVGIDSIAGPTDVTIIADSNNNPDFIAIDALSQLEHGIDSKAFVICDCENFIKKIKNSVIKISTKLKRQDILKESTKNLYFILINNIKDAHEISNIIAPEHLQIMTSENITNKIDNAGAIFIGEYTPEAIGDYIAGPSHTLPTNSTARFSSGLSVYDFLKRISYINCDKKSFNKISKSAMIMADSEGLDAHKLSIEIRNENN